jgi:hypothetical protein
VKDPGVAKTSETIGRSPGSCEFGSGGDATEMINDGSPDTNGKVLVEGVGEHLLPTAQAWGVGLLRPSVAAPGTGDGHIDLFWPPDSSYASVTKLQDLLC